MKRLKKENLFAVVALLGVLGVFGAFVISNANTKVTACDKNFLKVKRSAFLKPSTKDCLYKVLVPT